MLAYIQLHYKEIWAITATLLFGISEMLGLSEKAKSNAVLEFLLNLVKKSAKLPDDSSTPPPAA